MRLAWALLSALCVGMGIVLLYLFILIHPQETPCVGESNPLILWAETIMSGAIAVFGLYMFVSLLRTKWTK